MNTHIAIALAVALGLTGGFTSSARAQQMKPGLWEVETKMQLSPEQQKLAEKMQAAMKSTLAKMKPEERAKIEASMGEGTRPQMSKACLSEADVKADRPPGNMPASCKFESKRSGNAMTTTWSCDAPKTAGKATYAFTGGGTAYTSEATSDTGGMKMTVTARGKWLGADCQGLKSPTELMKK